jgi:single-stranded-DNA-specific exonuclease
MVKRILFLVIIGFLFANLAFSQVKYVVIPENPTPGEPVTIAVAAYVTKAALFKDQRQLAKADFFNVPSIAISLGEEVCTGSLRSARGYNVCVLLEQCSDLFIDSGGHQAAGGFSMVLKNWDSFLDRLKKISAAIEFDQEQDEETIQIDAELPHEYLTPEILKLIDRFEPYGKENEQLIFMTKNLTVKEINFIGKPEAKHIKMTLDSGKHKWPALYWQSADRITNGEFGLNDKVDAVFSITRDYYRGNETPQMMIIDLRKN